MTLVKLGEGLSGKLAEQWATAIVTPAFVFWLGGLVVWLSARGFGDGWLLVEAWVRALPGSMQIALAVAALLLFAASGMLAQRLTLPILRILEGYWPAPAASLKRWLVDRVGGRIQERQVRWNELAARIDNGNATPEERDEARRIDLLLRMYPTRPEDYMPTRLGNILRAAEGWPTDKYGLDAVKCWPGLWLVLPEATRKEIADARARLDSAATIWLWGVLFAVWTFWAWWALPVAVVSACIAYYAAMLSHAYTYGKLIEAAFDVHRAALYSALRWPLPALPSKERDSGEAITRYLWRGSEEPTPVFVKPRT
jgi:hypothetical protein